jgi:tetratricopeptide (TPR) repeat protein
LAVSPVQAEDHSVKKPQRHSPSNTAPPTVLAERGLDALRRDRFKEAVELFKQALRVEPRPEWKISLADAYLGRARSLATKGMFKEAAMVLENTIQLQGAVRDPNLFVSCLIRDGQQQKAAVYLLNHLPDQESLEALTAALLVSVPRLPDLAPTATPEQRRWHSTAIASRAALAAWCEGAAAAEIDRQLNTISLRSAFRPLRLLLKLLVTSVEDTDRARRVLDTIPPESPFYPLRQAIAATLLRDGALDPDTWHRLTPAQQIFVAETVGLTSAASQFLARLAEAERSGPGALFSFLLKQNDLPHALVRSACLNLLPRLPDRVSQFERSFGPLPLVDYQRILALAAENRGNWTAAGRFWTATAAAMTQAGPDRARNLAQGVIYRHLADLAVKHHEIEAEDDFSDPVVFYLQQARKADPDYLPSTLQLIEHYREEPSSKDWHQLVEETVKRFPNDARVLQQALDSALARKAYKQASGFARRLLQINAINPSVRRQMIELQIAYARKQMRAKRPDLALKGLKEAAEWERADAPSAPLRIAEALVEGQTGVAEYAEAKLREGVALGGGGVAGWFGARLEADLMKISGHLGWMRQALARALETPPTADAVMMVMSVLAQPQAGENKKVVASLLLGLRSWLQQGAAIDWKPAEFQVVAETLARFEAYDLLRDYAQAASRRDFVHPGWRFYDILGRTQGNPDRLSMAEEDDLASLGEAAAKREDFHMAARIGRFLEGEGSRRRRGHWGPARGDVDLDEEDMLALFGAMLSEMPKAAGANLRQRVQDIGREKAIAELAGQLEASVGVELPMTLLRELCAAMVAQAMDGSGRSRQGSARLGLPH